MNTQDLASSASSADGPTNRMHVSSKHVFWPESLLPSTVGNVKVYSFGYDADVERFMSSAGLNTVRLSSGKDSVIPIQRNLVLG